ncbi:unnamed protein product [marine sediment metagenome]|uniref:Uncharacterized protein n=1 Tax=marine sediment metagenome TaxID=412755 RepID=X1TJS2_9ZZZZ
MTEENKQPATQPQQICSIHIGFPVDTDEQAIEYKKKISAILADIPQVRIEFSLSAMPVRPMKPPQNV